MQASEILRWQLEAIVNFKYINYSIIDNYNNSRPSCHPSFPDACDTTDQKLVVFHVNLWYSTLTLSGD